METYTFKQPSCQLIEIKLLHVSFMKIINVLTNMLTPLFQPAFKYRSIDRAVTLPSLVNPAYKKTFSIKYSCSHKIQLFRETMCYYMN